MALRLGDDAPDFTAETTEGTINFHDWLGDSWGVLFSHPKDFTPVCTTELGARRQAQARVRQAQREGHRPVGRPARLHKGWAGDIEETQGTTLNFPLIADADRKVADLYDMIHPNANDTLTVRSVFIIGPDKKVKLIITYPASHRPQLRRDPAGHRLAAAHRRLQGGHAGQLEGRRRRHHRPRRLRRGRQGALPEGLEGRQALPAGHAPAQPVGRRQAPPKAAPPDRPDPIRRARFGELRTRVRREPRRRPRPASMVRADVPAFVAVRADHKVESHFHARQAGHHRRAPAPRDRHRVARGADRHH